MQNHKPGIGSLFGLVGLGSLVVLVGCQSTYYGAMEKLGHHKRDILVDRVQEARTAQQEAKDQFASALEDFTAVMNFEGGQLEAKYNKLKSELEQSEDKAQAVKKRLTKVEDVAQALFEEWEAELEQYSDERLRESSEQKLQETKDRYETYIVAMRQAEARIDPVLTAFRDQVLFLKHNLNAQAIASLHDEMITVETNVAGLIEAMEVSIEEADAFVQMMAPN